ncbi:hypothetical protein [Methylobacterium fujisawaense]|uniref:hypothetical protein n=1 Tax=Methylobacterium fujisawaense TaxID=107400 RepID=UPI00313CD981
MDALLALLNPTATPSEIEEDSADDDRPRIPAPDKISVITVNYFENPTAKGIWMQSKQAVKLQFFTKADERFTPHHSLAEIMCIGQLHQPDYVTRYLEQYRQDYEGSRSVPTAAQVDWYAKLTNETLAQHPDAVMAQLYDTAGTNYHWGSVVRLRPADSFGIIKLDLFLDGKRMTTIPLDQPNVDKNPKTENIKFRGRYDPKNLWKSKTKPKRKA